MLARRDADRRLRGAGPAAGRVEAFGETGEAEVLRLALATANVDTVAEAGCPTLHAAKAR